MVFVFDKILGVNCGQLDLFGIYFQGYFDCKWIDVVDGVIQDDIVEYIKISDF